MTAERCRVERTPIDVVSLMVGVTVVMGTW